MLTRPFWIFTVTCCSAVATLSSFIGDLIDNPIVAAAAGVALVAATIVALVILVSHRFRHWLQSVFHVEIPSGGAGAAALTLGMLSLFPLTFAALTHGLSPWGGVTTILARQIGGQELLERIDGKADQVLSGQEADRAVTLSVAYGQGACELNGYRRRTLVGYFQSQGSFYTMDNVTYTAIVSDGTQRWTMSKSGLQTLGIRHQGFDFCGEDAGEIWFCAVARDPISEKWYRWSTPSSDFKMASRGIEGEDAWLEMSLVVVREAEDAAVKCG